VRIGPNPTRGCVDEVSFHAQLLSETEFRQHLPVVLLIHVLQRSVYPENNREVMPKLYLGPERNMETNPSTHPQAVQKTWTIQNRYGRRYAKICIPPTVSLSDGRRLTGLRDLRPLYEKEGLYLECRWSQASGAVPSQCSGEVTRCR